MRRVFTYRSCTRVGGGWLSIAFGLFVLGDVLVHVIIHRPMPDDGQDASNNGLLMATLGSIVTCLVGVAVLIYAYRAQVIVDPSGIAAYGLGIHPKFAVGWYEITSIERIRGEETDYLRLRAGDRKVDLPTNIVDFDDLRRLIEANVPPHIPRLS